MWCCAVVDCFDRERRLCYYYYSGYNGCLCRHSPTPPPFPPQPQDEPHVCAVALTLSHLTQQQQQQEQQGRQPQRPVPANKHQSSTGGGGGSPLRLRLCLPECAPGREGMRQLGMAIAGKCGGFSYEWAPSLRRKSQAFLPNYYKSTSASWLMLLYNLRRERRPRGPVLRPEPRAGRGRGAAAAPGGRAAAGPQVNTRIMYTVYSTANPSH